MKQNKRTNEKDLRAIYIASKVGNLALEIFRVYGCSWKKAQDIAIEVVNKNYC